MKILVYILLIGTIYCAQAQKRTVGAIGFYNVENLFDTYDDENINDEEYLPDGKKEWTEDRYEDKLTKLAKVIALMANGADVLGLSEVENKQVIEDLVTKPQLKEHQYGIVHKNSPDKRGIDVALIYKKKRFLPIHSTWVRYPLEEYYTRDMLLCTGIYYEDTITVGVNHWPSRRSGPERRNMAGATLRKAVDSIQGINPKAKIILMGDFNDDPNNASIKKELRAIDKLKKLEGDDLYNTSATTFKQGYGSLSYKGAWNMFDQVIVSQSLLEGGGITYKPNSFSVFGLAWMRQQDGQYAGSPFRSFSWDKYIGGYSDHFPVYILLEK